MSLTIDRIVARAGASGGSVAEQAALELTQEAISNRAADRKNKQAAQREVIDEMQKAADQLRRMAGSALLNGWVGAALDLTSVGLSLAGSLATDPSEVAKTKELAELVGMGGKSYGLVANQGNDVAREKELSVAEEAAQHRAENRTSDAGESAQHAQRLMQQLAELRQAEHQAQAAAFR